MTAKEYLSQAWKIDKMVNAKLSQVTSLRGLAEKASATLSDMPPSGERNTCRMEDIIIKIVDLEREINADIDRLIDMKRDIMAAIKGLDNEEHRIVLELRYLCFMPWEAIIDEMRYSRTHVFDFHQDALSALEEKTGLRSMESD